MSDPISADFLGQKRRVRPVRKVQVSTHFDELNIAPNEAGTPEPPGLDEVIIKEVNNEGPSVTGEIPHPEARQAVYAGKFPSPPAELNTLVPEDFDFIDFNFKTLKPKKNEEEVIKTDHTFETIETSDLIKTETETMEQEIEVDNDKPSSADAVVAATTEDLIKTEPEAKESEAKVDNDKPLLVGAAVAATAAAVATTAAIVAGDTKEEPEKETTAAPLEREKAAVVSVINQKPLVKVSEARKSLEPSSVIATERQKDATTPVKSEPKHEVIESTKSEKESKSDETDKVSKIDEALDGGAIAGAAIVAATTAAIVASDEPKETVVEEVVAPAPLPTNNAHLVAVRESLKPSLLPVKPVNGAPLNDPDVPKDVSSSSPLEKTAVSSEELEALRKQLEYQKLELEKEIDAKKSLESQVQAMLSKSNAQEEALRYKNESLDKLQSDYLKTNNDLTAAKNEKDKLKESLAKAEAELAATSECNAKAYLEKSDEVAALKEKLAEFSALIGQKNKEIDSLQRQLDEAKRSNMQTALENVQRYEVIQDDLIKMVEEEILRMQDTIDEQREYNAKLHMEVDSEYAYWKTRLAKEGPTK